MQAKCGFCGTPHRLNDSQIGERRRVQFACSKCGNSTVVEVQRPPDQTQVISPLPEFARSSGAPRRQTPSGEDDRDLVLPPGKVIALSVISGPSRGLVFPLERPRVILGRAGSDLPLNDPKVSRHHCSIEVRGDVVRLRDLDSTNGTFFAEERVRAAELRNMSEFRIGSSLILLTIRPRLATAS
jgi:pSer/pThr/pTyr-binding forkhead associated (FHA) protein